MAKKKKKSKNRLIELDASELQIDRRSRSGAEFGIEPPSVGDFGIEIARSVDTIVETGEMKAAHNALKERIDELREERGTRRPGGFAAAPATDDEERIVATGIGIRTRDGVQTGEPAVKVLIDRRGFRSSQRISEQLPTDVRGMPVDVQVAGELKLHGYVGPFQQPIPCGVSISNFHADQRRMTRSSGTLGCLVRLDNNKLCLLTNNHVIGDFNNGMVGEDIIVHPGTLHTNNFSSIARLERVVPISSSGNLVDCAVAHTGSSLVSGGHVTYSLNPNPIGASLQLVVKKDGARTATTSGKVVMIDARVGPFDVPGIGPAFFEDQIVIDGGAGKFSDSGDSGALVVTTGSHRPVGLLFAGIGGHFTVANRIEHVMSALGIQEFIGQAAVTV